MKFVWYDKSYTKASYRSLDNALLNSHFTLFLFKPIKRGKLEELDDYLEYQDQKMERLNLSYTKEHSEYLKENCVQYNDFALIRTKTEKDRIVYINKILRNGCDLEEDIRVKYANIHTVKGLTFDNVIVDETRFRPEDYFSQLRLKYVAYSRGKYDCWKIASQDKYTLGVR